MGEISPDLPTLDQLKSGDHKKNPKIIWRFCKKYGDFLNQLEKFLLYQQLVLICFRFMFPFPACCSFARHFVLYCERKVHAVDEWIVLFFLSLFNPIPEVVEAFGILVNKCVCPWVTYTSCNMRSTYVKCMMSLIIIQHAKCDSIQYF